MTKRTKKLTKWSMAKQLARRLNEIDKNYNAKPVSILKDVTEFTQTKPNKATVIFEKQAMLYHVTLRKNGVMVFKESWIIK